MLTNKEERGRLKESTPRKNLEAIPWFHPFQKIFRRRARTGEIQVTYETTS